MKSSKTTLYIWLILTALVFIGCKDDEPRFKIEEYIEVDLAEGASILADGATETNINITIKTDDPDGTYPVTITTTLGTFEFPESDDPKKKVLNANNTNKFDVTLKSSFEIGTSLLKISTKGGEVVREIKFDFEAPPEDEVMKLTITPEGGQVVADGKSQMTIEIQLNGELDEDFLPLTLTTSRGKFKDEDDKDIELMPNDEGMVSALLTSRLDVGTVELKASLKGGGFERTGQAEFILPDLNTILITKLTDETLEANGFSATMLTIETEKDFYPLEIRTDLGSFEKKSISQMKTIMEPGLDGKSVVEIRSTLQSGTATIQVNSQDPANLVIQETIEFTSFNDEFFQIETPGEAVLADGGSEYEISIKLNDELNKVDDTEIFNREVVLSWIDPNNDFATIVLPMGIQERSTAEMSGLNVINRYFQAKITVGGEEVTILDSVEFRRAYPDFANIEPLSDSIEVDDPVQLSVELNRFTGSVSNDLQITYLAYDSLKENEVGELFSKTKSSNGKSTAMYRQVSAYLGDVIIVVETRNDAGMEVNNERIFTAKKGE